MLGRDVLSLWLGKVAEHVHIDLLLRDMEQSSGDLNYGHTEVGRMHWK